MRPCSTSVAYAKDGMRDGWARRATQKEIA